MKEKFTVAILVEVDNRGVDPFHQLANEETTFLFIKQEIQNIVPSIRVVRWGKNIQE